MSGRQAIALIWSPEARADLRAIERDTALQILYCLGHYLAIRTGDVKKLKPPRTDFRLRCGDYRVFFEANKRVGSRSQAFATVEKLTVKTHWYLLAST